MQRGSGPLGRGLLRCCKCLAYSYIVTDKCKAGDACCVRGLEGHAYIHSAVAGAEPGRIFSILANSHSLLQRGQALRVFSHRWMQSRWKTWPQVPQAILRPGCSLSPAPTTAEVTVGTQGASLHGPTTLPVKQAAGGRGAALFRHPPVGLAWYSMEGSYRLFLQMAQVSVQMAHDHIATAFHFFTSNRLPGALPLPFLSTCCCCSSSTCSPGRGGGGQG